MRVEEGQVAVGRTFTGHCHPGMSPTMHGVVFVFDSSPAKVAVGITGDVAWGENVRSARLKEFIDCYAISDTDSGFLRKLVSKHGTDGGYDLIDCQFGAVAQLRGDRAVGPLDQGPYASLRPNVDSSRPERIVK